MTISIDRRLSLTFLGLVFIVALAAPQLAFAEQQSQRSSGDLHRVSGSSVSVESASSERRRSARTSRASRSTANDEPLFPWAQEELFYSVRMAGSEAMRAGIRVGDLQNSGGRNYIPINGVARSRGFFHAIYPVDDAANTFFDPVSGRPLHSEKVFDENDRFRRYTVDYRHQDYLAQVERERNNRLARFQSRIPSDTHDMITWLYQLRRTENLSMGDEFSFYIYDGWLLSRLDLKVVGREDLLTPMGWFKTWRLDYTREIMETDDTDEEDSGPPSTFIDERARHTGSLWLSRDANLLPDRVTIDTILGAGEAVLIRYNPGSPQ